jgi:hypothetical protein
MKHPITTLNRADAPAGKGGGSEVSWKIESAEKRKTPVRPGLSWGELCLCYSQLP